MQDELFVTDAPESFKYEVLENACIFAKKSHDYVELIHLIIYNSFAPNDIRNRIVDALSTSGISPDALKKAAAKDNNKLASYYNSFSTGNEDFNRFFTRITDSVEPQKGSSLLSSVTGFFKKK